MIIGIDEVGRGAWAGPMLFCAVALEETIEGLGDSKTLSKHTRQLIASKIKQKASFIGYGWVSAIEIDDIGLTKASKLAIKRAIKKAPLNAEIIIDGSVNFLEDYPNSRCMVNGDSLVPQISSASILAKVERDKHMSKLHKIYSGYDFINNVGYGTKKHSDAIKKYGLTPEHRWSYKPIRASLNEFKI